MRQYTWGEYYEKFYDWAESTQVRNLSGLTSLGPADEVGEIIIELQVNVPAANRLLRKAVDAKLVYISTDYVFDGQGEIAFLEGDKKDPLNFYGLTKYEGELEVTSLLEKYFIVRI